MDDDKVIDFAIVGAGVAGTYAAWRLATAPYEDLKELVPRQATPPTIRLFEASERIGGRLHTERMPGMSACRAELGGMRFTEDQVLVRSLVAHLQLPCRVFDYPMRLM